jgi:hypothetical protein
MVIKALKIAIIIDDDYYTCYSLLIIILMNKNVPLPFL